MVFCLCDFVWIARHGGERTPNHGGCCIPDMNWSMTEPQPLKVGELPKKPSTPKATWRGQDDSTVTEILGKVSPSFFAILEGLWGQRLRQKLPKQICGANPAQLEILSSLNMPDWRDAVLQISWLNCLKLLSAWWTHSWRTDIMQQCFPDDFPIQMGSKPPTSRLQSCPSPVTGRKIGQCMPSYQS